MNKYQTCFAFQFRLICNKLSRNLNKTLIATKNKELEKYLTL